MNSVSRQLAFNLNYFCHTILLCHVAMKFKTYFPTEYGKGNVGFISYFSFCLCWAFVREGPKASSPITIFRQTFSLVNLFPWKTANSIGRNIKALLFSLGTDYLNLVIKPRIILEGNWIFGLSLLKLKLTDKDLLSREQ